MSCSCKIGGGPELARVLQIASSRIALRVCNEPGCEQCAYDREAVIVLSAKLDGGGS